MTWSIPMGGRTFEVPLLSLRQNAKVYPRILRLIRANLLTRAAEARGALDATEEEMGELIELCFDLASAADPDLDRDTFEALPVAPGELLDAFFLGRYATGGWVLAPATEAPGEGEGDATLPTSTSAASSRGSPGTSTSASSKRGKRPSPIGSKSTSES